MATLTVRNLSDEELAEFRVLAAEHGRSMEAEARQLIRAALPKRACAMLLEDEGPGISDPEIDARIERAQAKVRAMFGGVMPKGRVDAFLAERREAAARGE